MNEVHNNSKFIIENPPKLVRNSYRQCSADIAPVHGSKASHIDNMESRIASEWQQDPSNTECDGKDLSAELKDKLSLKNGVMNGIRLGTTDVQVHYVAPSGITRVHPKPFDEPSVSGTSKVLSSSKQCEDLILVNKVPVKFIEEKSIVNRSSRDSCVNVNDKPEVNGTVCNGHSVSDEATGSTNSIAISEFSIGSEKSSDSSASCSGVKPRTRNASNSSSQGTQPRSDASLSSTSDCVKTPEISLSPIIPSIEDDDLKVEYVNYENENQMSAIMRLIQKDLSEPYSIYTYRYFIHNWPKLCFLVSNHC